MSQFKYIIFDNGNVLGGVAFSPVFRHDTISVPNGKPLSAGFITIRNGTVECSGASNSLKLASAPGDEQFFQWLLQ